MPCLPVDYLPVSTTLSDPELKAAFGLVHPPHVLRSAEEEQAREDLLDDRADLREREPRADATAHPLALEEGGRDRRNHGGMPPAGIRPAFEVIEADRPALMGRPDQRAETGRGGQIADEVPVVRKSTSKSAI